AIQFCDGKRFGQCREQYFRPRRWFQSGREDAWDKESGNLGAPEPVRDIGNVLEVVYFGSIQRRISLPFIHCLSDELEAWPEKKQGETFGKLPRCTGAVNRATSFTQDCSAEFDVREGHEHFGDLNPVFRLYQKRTNHHVNGRVARLCQKKAGTVATSHPDFALDNIVSLHTCTLYTVARTESGVLSLGQRKRIWDKYKAG
ncbi:hypothetical protein pipiens_020513, partial [Culex pipiens pipiens]